MPTAVVGRLVPGPWSLHASCVPGAEDWISMVGTHRTRTMPAGEPRLGVRKKANVNASYLVDPASSHMLVSKIKPCMSKYKLLHSETANGSLNQLWFLRSYNPTWITVVILELIHATKLRPSGKSAFIRSKPIGTPCRPFDESG